MVGSSRTLKHASPQHPKCPKPTLKSENPKPRGRKTALLDPMNPCSACCQCESPSNSSNEPYTLNFLKKPNSTPKQPPALQNNEDAQQINNSCGASIFQQYVYTCMYHSQSQICMHTHIYIYMCTYVYIYIHMYVRMCGCVPAFLYICMHVWTLQQDPFNLESLFLLDQPWPWLRSRQGSFGARCLGLGFRV